MDKNNFSSKPDKKTDSFSDNEKLFSGNQASDDIDFFDIDAHRQERAQQPNVDYAKSPSTPPIRQTPRRVKVISSQNSVKKAPSSIPYSVNNNIRNESTANTPKPTVRKPVNSGVTPVGGRGIGSFEKEQPTAEYNVVFPEKDNARRVESELKEQLKTTLPKTTPQTVKKTVQTGIQRTNSVSQTRAPENKSSETRAFPKVSGQTPIRNQNTPISFKVSTPPTNEKVKKTNRKTQSDKPGIPGFVKALIYIGSVFLVSIIAASIIISISNDVFAFVKDDVQIELSVKENATLDDIADILKQKKVIKYPNVFVMWSKLRHHGDESFLSGDFTVTPTQNYDELLKNFTIKKSVTQYTEISVTIPEGYTVDEIITLLVDENGVGSREGFIEAIQNYEYDYWFVKELENTDPDRKYRLEGYLYPDTYYIYKEWEEWRVINKILANFYNKFSKEYRAECESLGYSVDDVVNIASIIQMESMYPKEYTAVSSVLHNRLKNGNFRYMLECCSTVQYILPERVKRLSAADTQIDNQYNSYLYPGLPPGPISNPTMQAIRAALYPENTNYYYFVARDDDGTLMFAKTLAEHNINKAQALTD